MSNPFYHLVPFAIGAVASALQRPESRGLNYNLDYPNADPAWAQRDRERASNQISRAMPAGRSCGAAANRGSKICR